MLYITGTPDPPLHSSSELHLSRTRYFLSLPPLSTFVHHPAVEAPATRGDSKPHEHPPVNRNRQSSSDVNTEFRIIFYEPQETLTLTLHHHRKYSLATSQELSSLLSRGACFREATYSPINMSSELTSIQPSDQLASTSIQNKYSTAYSET